MEYDNRLRDLNDPDPQVLELEDEVSEDQVIPPSHTSLNGDDLRQFRAARDFTVDYSISLTASQFLHQAKPSAVAAKPKLLTLTEGLILAHATLENMQFMVSPTQPDTPADGNCFLHALVDQMSYDSLLVKMKWTANKARTQVVANSELVIATKGLEWPGDISIDAWRANMANDFVYADQVFIQIAAQLLNRPFMLVTVHKESGDNKSGKILITPQTSIGNPLYFLYFTESKFLSPHYQSIRPLVEDDSVIQRQRLRISSIPDESGSFSPDVQSSKLTQSRKRKNESSKSQLSRETSYMNSDNIISGKRTRKQK